MGGEDCEVDRGEILPFALTEEETTFSIGKVFL